ncbi:WD40 repeat domain-containing protein [Nostoc sp. DedQUE07]|uniref:WD40 repeat domain-containing protein n=1 Tax=Nostoc sp. DedQUE07 TaxID=3075392 RepID=UPI002AD3CEA2|nr:WD40 repeat domain-containing protein [Nostoc sp. DedQUE07]MDZ8129723.1 WD40 repeat domain-containing protein [Nostoc sp. DedQUE07]
MGQIATKFASLELDDKLFYLDRFPKSTLKVAEVEEYYQTLTDFDFIYLKTQYPQFGIEALIRDYSLIEEPEILENLEEDEKLETEQLKTLKLIQRTLELSAHVLNQDQTQLVGQLWGRLQSFPQSEIQKILADAVQSKSEIPRFRPITASLTTPGGNLLRTLTGHNSPVNAVAITPDGKTAVSGSNDRTLKVWDLQTGKEMEISPLTGHNDSVRAVAIAPDGKTAVSGSQDSTLKVWDLQTGKEISTLTDHNDSVSAVAIAPDGKTAVSGYYEKIAYDRYDHSTLKVWDLQTGKEISTLTDHNYPVRALAIASDGKTAVSGWDRTSTLKVWDLQTGKEISTLAGHNSRVNAVAIAPDGKTAVSGSDDKTLKVWDLQTGKEISTLTGHNDSVSAVAISLDGKTAVSGSYEEIAYYRYDHSTLKVWDLQTGKEISTLTSHNDPVSQVAIAIAPDGKTAVSGSDDNTLKVWDLQTGKEISTLTSHNSRVNAVAITSDGKKAISGSWDNTLKLWDLEAGKEISTFIVESPINCCAISPDGFTILAGDTSGRVHFLRLEGD